MTTGGERIAFVGLGIMGLPMAINLVQAGFNVAGYNRSPAATRWFGAQGGTAAGSLEEAVADASMVITMLPDSPDVEAVVLGPGGALEHAEPGCLLIDMSTIRPDVARLVAERASVAGRRALDAPVSGGEAGAVEGSLSIMVGGDPADLARCRHVLDVLGTTVVHVGPSGAGQLVKAANQLVVAGTIELVAEAAVFLEAYGVDTAAAFEVLGGGLAGSRVIERKAGGMLRRDFRPGFRAELHHKDLGIALEAARHAGVVVPLGAVVAQLMGALVSQGSGRLDHSALLQLVEQLSGRAPRQPAEGTE